MFLITEDIINQHCCYRKGETHATVPAEIVARWPEYFSEINEGTSEKVLRGVVENIDGEGKPKAAPKSRNEGKGAERA